MMRAPVWVHERLTSMRKLLALIFVTAMLTPSVALASGSSCDAYNPQLCQVGSNVVSRATGAGATNKTAAAGTLPFTGLDIALLMAGASVLIGGGLVLRRFSDHSRS